MAFQDPTTVMGVASQVIEDGDLRALQVLVSAGVEGPGFAHAVLAAVSDFDHEHFVRLVAASI